MPRFKKALMVLLATAPLVFGQASVVFAAETKNGYLCKIKPYSCNGWVPTTMELRFTEKDAKVVVWYNFMAYMKVDPKTVNVKMTKDGKQRFRWSTLLRTDDGVPINVAFRVDLDSKTHSGVIKANVPGSSGRPNGGTFTCNAAKVK